MTLDEFLKRLRKTPRDWRKRGGAALRRELRDRMVCPIDAVARRPDAWMRSQPLGLTYETKCAIIAAADAQRGHDRKLRKKLLQACGLSRADD